jgi:hypothetical protein
MALNKASIQNKKSLEEFYGNLRASEDSVSSSIGACMLDFLPLLRDLCDEVNAWALTSLMRLWLLPSDDIAAPWLVSVQPMPSQGFQITYRFTAPDAPWPDALVQGVAIDEADACRMVRIAMERSGGWSFDGTTALS